MRTAGIHFVSRRTLAVVTALSMFLSQSLFVQAFGENRIESAKHQTEVLPSRDTEPEILLATVTQSGKADYQVPEMVKQHKHHCCVWRR